MLINIWVIDKDVTCGRKKFDFSHIANELSKLGLSVNKFTTKLPNNEVLGEIFDAELNQNNINLIIAKEDFLEGKIGHPTVKEFEGKVKVYNPDNSYFFVYPIENFKEAFLKTTNLIASLDNFKYKEYIFKLFAISEHSILSKINEYIDNSDKVRIGIVTDMLYSTVYIRAREGNDKLLEYKEKIYEILKDYVYADEDITLDKAVFEALKKLNLTLATAESITGGSIASTLVLHHPGISKILIEGIAVYTNKAKMELVGVSKDTLEKETDVSYETTYELATGLLKQSGADIVLTTTGFASPTEGRETGETFIAVGTKEEIHVYKCLFSGSREEIITQARDFAYFKLLQILKLKAF